MSATMVVRGLAAGHGERVLFTGLDLVVSPGDVIGLVGGQRRGQVDPAAHDGSASTGPRRARSGSARPPPPSATCRRSPIAGRVRP
ncbi:hypothetical protein ACFSTC_53305 [Nonomuraea ferruginea]